MSDSVHRDCTWTDYITHSTRVGGRTHRSDRPATAATEKRSRGEFKKIRAWATERATSCPPTAGSPPRSSRGSTTRTDAGLALLVGRSIGRGTVSVCAVATHRRRVGARCSRPSGSTPERADPEMAPDYNVAPTKTSPVVIARVPKETDEERRRQLRNLEMGHCPVLV